MDKKNVKKWMLSHLRGDGDHLIDRSCNDVDMTQLAENAAHEFDHDEWLDDETHWVWDAAAEVAQVIEKDRP